jgi:hypothetical protein
VAVKVWVCSRLSTCATMPAGRTRSMGRPSLPRAKSMLTHFASPLVSLHATGHVLVYSVLCSDREDIKYVPCNSLHQIGTLSMLCAVSPMAILRCSNTLCRCCGADHPLELPTADAGLEAGARPRWREHRRHEGVLSDHRGRITIKFQSMRNSATPAWQECSGCGCGCAHILWATVAMVLLCCLIRWRSRRR